MQDLMLIQRNWACFCNIIPQIIAKTSSSLQLSVRGMLNDVNFPTYDMADLHYGELMRSEL